MKITRIENGKKVVYLQLKDIAWMYDRGDFVKWENLSAKRGQGRIIERASQHEKFLGIHGKLFKNEHERFGAEEMQRYVRFEDEEEIKFIEAQKVKLYVETYDMPISSGDVDNNYYRAVPKRIEKEKEIPAFIDWTDCEKLTADEFYTKYKEIYSAYNNADAQLSHSIFPIYGERRAKFKRTTSSLKNVADDINHIVSAKQGKYDHKAKLIVVHLPEDDKPLPPEPEFELEGLFF